ncbi:hypothetical protein WJ438_03185 [Streptomyces sp. GD-15H]|uniref:DUF7800 domain-containing protein n=1 Tax=Streptomyces sp. GD-15H TaxID=3129112 RepID=UPI0032538945
MVLAGPVVRRVDAESATVWVALKAPRKVTLEVREGAAGDPAAPPLLQGTRVTARIGEHLHLVAVTATGDALRPGTLYRYAMRFSEDTATPSAPAPATAPDLFAAGVVAATPEEARRRLVYEEAPGAPAAPGFVTPPDNAARLRIFHTANRKPHGDGPDALSLLDQVLRADAGSAATRPQQLFLTGDQIYADDVAEAMLHLCTTRGRALLGRDETFPGLPDPERALHPGFRRKPARELFGVTTHRCDSHLLRFSEFCAMYLLAWSDVLWPEFPRGRAAGSPPSSRRSTRTSPPPSGCRRASGCPPRSSAPSTGANWTPSASASSTTPPGSTSSARTWSRSAGCWPTCPRTPSWTATTSPTAGSPPPAR